MSASSTVSHVVILCVTTDDNLRREMFVCARMIRACSSSVTDGLIIGWYLSQCNENLHLFGLSLSFLFLVHDNCHRPMVCNHASESGGLMSQVAFFLKFLCTSSLCQCVALGSYHKKLLISCPVSAKNWKLTGAVIVIALGQYGEDVL
jgi:hypothetical protein